MRSSISSSEKSFPKKGKPRALIAGLVMVCVVELILHIVPAGNLLGYGAGLGSYYEVAHSIQEFGAADIAFLGTSRGRESIALPLLKEQIKVDFGKELSAANYSCAGSHADEMLQISKLIVASDNRPKIVLYFLSPGILRGEVSDGQRLSILGKFPDFFSGRTGQVITAQTEKPFWLIRQWLDKNYLTFRHRHRFRHLLTSFVRGRKPVSAIQGEYSMWQLYAANRSLVSHPVSQQRIETYIKRLLDDDGKYIAGSVHLNAVKETIKLFQDNNIPIVVLAAGMSPDLAALMPNEVLEKYFQSIDTVTGQAGLNFWKNRDLGVDLLREDFREQSHMNLSGAQKVTDAVYNQFIKPIIEQEE